MDWDGKDGKPNLDQLKQGEKVIVSIPFVSPQRLINWKDKKGRTKDILDIELLDDYLKIHF
jgi:hypothetical protein